MVKKLFAIAGADETGKSTLACYLSKKINNLGYDSVITNFAFGVYQVVAINHNLSIEDILINKADYREELREVGESKRKAHPRYWITWLENRLLDLNDLGSHDIVIIDDLRFLQEAEFVKQIGGEILYLDRSISKEEMNDSTFRELPSVCCQADNHLISKSKSPQDLAKELKEVDQWDFSENVKITYRTYLSRSKNNHPQCVITPLHQIANNLKGKVKDEDFEDTLIQVLNSMTVNHSI